MRLSQFAYPDGRAYRLTREALQRAWSSRSSPARHLDVVVILAALALSGFGLLMIYAATMHRLAAQGADPGLFVQRQLVALVLGLLALAAVVAFDYRHLRALAPVLYVVALCLLGLVLAVGTVVNGAQAWLVVGPLQLQPSELAKPALIVTLAAVLTHRKERAERRARLGAVLAALALAGPPMVAILAQPDFGTFMVFAALVFVMLLVADVKIRYLVALVALGIMASVGAVRLGVVQDYQLERVTAFLHPEQANTQSEGWNVNQAQIAIGSGQLVGQGLFQGTQTSLAYVPENHTDFIFTVVGEELGFVGAAGTLAAYLLLIWRGLRIAAVSRDRFGTLIAGGVVAVFVFQAFVNVGMALGLMPVSGLPLPFISYGGTSLIASLLMVGLLCNIHMRRFRR